MKYCGRCLFPANQPLNIIFDQDGVCSGCRVHEEKNTLDWGLRFEKLKRIVESYKTSSRSINNCIVPVSGARDSYFIVHIVKNVLGLNPLLVTYNKHYICCYLDYFNFTTKIRGRSSWNWNFSG